jgi:hypothetical protein
MPDGLTYKLLSAKWARTLLQEPSVHALGMETVSTRQQPGAIVNMQGSETDGANGLVAAAGGIALLHEWLRLLSTGAKLEQCLCSKVCSRKGDLCQTHADSDRPCCLPLGNLALQRPCSFPKAEKSAPVERVALRGAGSK